MEQALRPEKLDLDPQMPDAGNAFELWLACFEAYLEEIKATDSVAKRRVLLSRVSPRVYSLIRDQPNYDGAMNALKRQYLRLINSVYARHHLATRQQRSGESSAEFVRALQTLVRACNCQELTAVQHAELLVRDTFVMGTRSVYVRQWPLEKADLTLSSAIELADTLEAALHNSEALQARDPPMASWVPQTPQPAGESTSAAASRESGKCYFCGLEKHPRKRCAARQATCSSCGKGHFAKVCKSKPRAGSSSAACETWGSPSSLHTATTCETWGPPSSLPPSSLHAATTCETWGWPSWSAPPPTAYDQRVLMGHPTAPDQDSDPTLASVTLDQSAPHQLARSMMDILVEGHRTSSLFDTGSTESFIHPATVQHCGLMIRPVSQRVTMASGSHTTDIRGDCVAKLVVQGTEYRDFTLLVLPQLCAPVLLGLDFQSHLKSVTMKYEVTLSNTMFLCFYDGPLPPITVINPLFCRDMSRTPLLTTHTHRPAHPTQHHANCHTTDTTCGLSTLRIPPPPLFANLTPDCKPVATKSRRYSAGDRAFTKSEVQRLLREGVIEASTSPWRAQVVVVQNGEKNRMVVDYSQIINRFTQLDAYPLPCIADMVNQIAQYKVYSTIDLKSAYHQLPIRREDRPYTAFEADGRL
ncbi:uncharacterized protein LOC134342847 [Mobula hypostoma]|uniref:uncharacterized protein LOC134342847 n=1 Tax=Mobula hypostoma TaxID=723540 RepID=UPI002FC2E140